MAPRHPPERPNDEPSKLQKPVDNASSDITPENENPVPETKRNEPRSVKAEEDENDRIEAYLRGPTAFTA